MTAAQNLLWCNHGRHFSPVFAFICEFHQQVRSFEYHFVCGCLGGFPGKELK